jgi:hypothetical protein
MTAGDVVFTCEDCGRLIMALGYHDDVPVCGICRYIRAFPEMPEEIKAKLRGDDDPPTRRDQ